MCLNVCDGQLKVTTLDRVMGVGEGGGHTSITLNSVINAQGVY